MVLVGRGDDINEQPTEPRLELGQLSESMTAAPTLEAIRSRLDSITGH